MSSLKLPNEIIYHIRDFVNGSPKQIYNKIICDINRAPLYLDVDDGLITFLYMINNRYSGFQCNIADVYGNKIPSVSRIIFDHLRYNKLCKKNKCIKDTVVAVSDDLIQQYILRYEHEFPVPALVE